MVGLDGAAVMVSDHEIMHRYQLGIAGKSGIDAGTVDILVGTVVPIIAIAVLLNQNLRPPTLQITAQHGLIEQSGP